MGRRTDDGGRSEQRREATEKPLVYSCSGCSSAAQMANDLAIRLDRHGSAEMSCIAGVGGDVPSLVRVAKSGRPILALDGCPLICVAATLKRHGVTPDEHVILSRYGVRKRKHADFDRQEADELFGVVAEAATKLSGTAKEAGPPATKKVVKPAVKPIVRPVVEPLT